MGILGRKPKMTLEEFCQDFYDLFFYTGLFGEDLRVTPKISNIDAGSLILDTAFEYIAKADDRFAKVDRSTFRREMTALRVELFGLAWMHNFKAKKNFEYCLRECSFTKKYLQSIGRNEIWDIMVFYNKAAARSAFEICSGKRARRAQRASFSWLRMELYGDLRAKTDFDQDCIALVLNRFGTDIAWKRKITLKLLVAEFVSRLECPRELNDQAFLNLGIVMVGMYNGARDAITSTKIVL